jgi:hypothetical protein
MRCPQCQFENMPDETRCFRCGSVLLQDKVLDVHPPRMSAWKKPWRNIFRFMRQRNALPENSIRFNVRGWLLKMIDDPYGSILISIIPGLSHYTRGRFREIRIFWFAWLAMLLSSIFFYGSSIGFYLLALAITVHAWIAVQLALIRQVTEFHKRIVAMLIIIAGLWFIYNAAGRVIFFDFLGSPAAFSLPAQNIQEGDYLLGRRSLAHRVSLKRGTLVIARLNTVRIGGHDQVTTIGQSQIPTVAQIVGLENEQVTIENNALIVNGQALDTEKFPVPKWLQQRHFTFNIPADHYMVSTEYAVNMHGIALTDDIVRNALIVPGNGIEAKVFMRWMPLSRRGFIGYSQ